MTRRVLVTGATGFLGSVVVRKLIERGCEVHALVRESSDRSILAGLEVEWHVADVADSAGVDRVFEAIAKAGAFDVVHSAALISYDRRDAELQRRANVDGTRSIVEACERRGVRRLLHVSSVVAVAHSDEQNQVTENASFNGADLGVGYVTTKRAAEDLVFNRDSKLEVVVVNPAAIFGTTKRATSNSARLLGEVKRGKRFLAAPPGGVTLVGVEDVAEGCLLALERGRAGERYSLGESFWTVRQLLSFLSNECGGNDVRRTLPRPLWNAAVFAVRVVDRLVPMRYVTPQSLTMLGLHWNLDCTKARRELDWNPEPSADVLRRALHELT